MPKQIQTLMLFGVEHTRQLCPSCERSRSFLRRETMMPVPRGASAPLSELKGMGRICFDCAAAETARRFNHGLTWEMARIAVGNDRQEKLRLPGAPIGLPYVRAATQKDIDRLHAWQDEVLPEETSE
jgi:hypothetical protein